MDRDEPGEASVAFATCVVRRPRHLEQVEVVVAEPELRSFPERVSQTLGVCLKLGAAHDVDADGTRLQYPADAIAVRPPGCVWHCPPQGAGFVSIDVEPGLLPDRPLPGSMTFLPPSALGSFVPAVQTLLQTPAALRSEEILVGLIDRVLDLSRGGGVEPRSAVDDRTVDQARQYLATNVSAHPTLDAVARAVGVDKYTLVRRFRRAGATTPHRYLVMLRLEQAREQLARGTSPAEAAQAAGFADQAHLTRWFRRYFGTTPAAYRRQVRSVHGLPSISFKIGPPPGPTVPGHEQARARPDQPGGGDTPSRTLRGPAGAAEPH